MNPIRGRAASGQGRIPGVATCRSGVTARSRNNVGSPFRGRTACYANSPLHFGVPRGRVRFSARLWLPDTDHQTALDRGPIAGPRPLLCVSALASAGCFVGAWHAMCIRHYISAYRMTHVLSDPALASSHRLANCSKHKLAPGEGKRVNAFVCNAHKKADLRVGFFVPANRNYLEADALAAAGAAAAASADAAGAEAAGAAASAEAAGAEAAGAAASVEAAGAAAAGAAAGAAGSAAAGAAASSFLPQAARATASREAINSVFFMDFPSKLLSITANIAMNNYR